MNATAAPPAEVRPRPLPPTYALWVESEDDIAPDLVATANTLEEAIARAAPYARQSGALVIITESATGQGWAVQHIETRDTLPAAAARQR